MKNIREPTCAVQTEKYGYSSSHCLKTENKYTAHEQDQVKEACLYFHVFLSIQQQLDQSFAWFFFFSFFFSNFFLKSNTKDRVKHAPCKHPPLFIMVRFTSQTHSLSLSLFLFLSFSAYSVILLMPINCDL
jgi:hypothetical protein